MSQSNKRMINIPSTPHLKQISAMNVQQTYTEQDIQMPHQVKKESISQRKLEQSKQTNVQIVKNMFPQYSGKTKESYRNSDLKNKTINQISNINNTNIENNTMNGQNITPNSNKDYCIQNGHLNVNKQLFTDNMYHKAQTGQFNNRVAVQKPKSLNSAPLIFIRGSDNTDQVLQKLKQYQHDNQINQLKTKPEQQNNTFEQQQQQQQQENEKNKYQQYKFMNQIESKLYQQPFSKNMVNNNNKGVNTNNYQNNSKTNNMEQNNKQYVFNQTQQQQTYNNNMIQQLSNNIQEMMKDMNNKNYQKVNNDFILNIKQKNFQEVREVIRHEMIDPLYKDDKKLSGLYYSVLGGQLQMTNYILEYFSANYNKQIKQIVNITDHQYQNLLMLAIRKNQPQIFQLLIDYGCDINYQDDTGQSVLHMAVMFKNNQIVDLLMKNASLNKDLVDCQNQKAFHKASLNQLQDYIDDSSVNYDLSQFDVLGLVGKGSFGDVYLVEHKETKIKYALKQLNKKQIISNLYNE